MRAAQEHGAVGRTLQTVLQQALRVGKRAHAETGLDKAGPSLVEAGLGPRGARRAAARGARADSRRRRDERAGRRHRRPAGGRALSVTNRTLSVPIAWRPCRWRVVALDRCPQPSRTPTWSSRAPGPSARSSPWIWPVLPGPPGRPPPGLRGPRPAARRRAGGRRAGRHPGRRPGTARPPARRGRRREDLADVRALVAQEVELSWPRSAPRPSRRPWWRCARWPARWSRRS